LELADESAFRRCLKILQDGLSEKLGSQDAVVLAAGWVGHLLALLTAKRVRFDDQTSLSGSECGFVPDLDLPANFPYGPRYESAVSSRSQRVSAHTARKVISYPFLPFHASPLDSIRVNGYI
jgi:hypothetical protein